MHTYNIVTNTHTQLFDRRDDQAMQNYYRDSDVNQSTLTSSDLMYWCYNGEV